MNKKTLFVIVLLSMFLTLPAFSGQAIVSPDEMANYTSTGEDNNNNDLTTNDWSEDYDGNQVDIIEIDDQNTIILMNNTYELQIHHNDTSMGVTATQLDPTPLMSAQADVELFDIEFNILPSGKFLEINLPTAHIELEQAPYEDDTWHARINEELTLDINSTERSIGCDLGPSHIDMQGDQIFYTDASNPGNNFEFTRMSNEQFLIMTPDGLFDVTFNDTRVGVDWVAVMPVYPLGPHLPFQWSGIAPMVSISFVDNCVMVEWEEVTVQILLEMIIIIIDIIVITWYFLLIIEMLTIFIFDITIIFYLTIVELILVIIYETIEIKIYETQVVIVYQYIEIVFIFVSILIWQMIFIFHFEFWFIQIIFLIDLVVFAIINQVRIIFIPVIIPVFIPVIYYVPVIIKEYVNVYVPYAAEQLFIDIYDEDLKNPNHTIQYRVVDQLDNPILDATVDVDYNGTIYPAIHLGSGIYQVVLPASDELETITVTASKIWYPTATLTYDLEVTWIDDIITTTVTETETAPTPLSIISVIVSLFAVSIGAMVINKKKKK
ncbi:MAG: hypothetical protein ACTSO7_03470 [Candidatus Heimdallarchaeota archaeon]